MKKFLTDIKNIRNAIDTNRLVVFAGAGISVDAEIPLWGTLIDEMKAEIDIPFNEHDYLRIAQMYFNERQQKEYIEKIRSVLNHKKAVYNEIHESILKLNPLHILTTNYDDLLEQVIRRESLPFSIVSKDKEFPYALNTNLLVKIHGDLKDSDVVLKEDDYLDYSINHPLIESFIKSIFASKVVLFIGYGFSDINLKIIIQTVRNILNQDFQNAYLLSIDENLHPAQIGYLKNKGINLINYFDADKDGNSNFIIEYLNGKNSHNKVFFKKGDKLSEKGQNLLNFLTFLSKYDKFNDPISSKHVIEQVYLSLDRFSELESLPPDFVVNLFPFNRTNSYVHSPNLDTLLLSHELESLFFDEIKIENNRLVYTPKMKDKSISISTEEIEKKLIKIVEVLNKAGINYFEKREENSDNPIKSDNLKRRLEILPNTKCQCLNCRFNRLEFNELIHEILNSNITETTNLKNDLEIAFIVHKIGNFSQSYKLFQEIANKAWQAGKYITYYIAKHNVKSLRNLIKYDDLNINTVNRDKIVQELDNIDFDKLLSQIPNLGESEYRLLKTIRDDKVVSKATYDIDENYSKVFDIYETYKYQRGTYQGPFYPKLIYNDIIKVINFYTSNCILGDEFGDILKLINKGFEAIFINFATDKSYKQRIENFNCDFFQMVIHYAYPEKLTKTLKRFEISEIIFEENQISQIIETTNNFFKSFYEEDTFWGIITSEEKNLRNQTSNFYFENKCRKIFKNIFILLSAIELDESYSRNIVSNFTNFLKHETFLSETDIEYALPFLIKNSEYFNQENLTKLLEVIPKKYEYYYTDKFLQTISYCYNHNKFEGITNRSLIYNLLSVLEEDNPNKKELLVYLWSISGLELKEEIKKKILDILNLDFDPYLYVSSVQNNVIGYEEYFERYLQEINNKKGDGSYKIISNNIRFNNLIFINAIHFIYSLHLEINDKRLKILTNLPSYMTFLLFPEEFNYSEFKIEWLKMVKNEDDFFQRFSKIPALKREIETSLKSDFNQDLARSYVKYFV